MSYKEIRELPLSSSRIKRGGYEIRTREGVNPTRFPSERHRPLGESSAGNHTRGRGLGQTWWYPVVVSGGSLIAWRLRAWGRSGR